MAKMKVRKCHACEDTKKEFEEYKRRTNKALNIIERKMDDMKELVDSW